MIVGEIRLTDTAAQIDAKIIHALGREIKKKSRRAAQKAAAQLVNLVDQLIMNSPEVQSLQNGILRHHIGLLNPSTRIKQIVDIWKKSIKASGSVKTSNDSLSYIFSLRMIKDNWSDVLDLPAATFTTPENDHELPWLWWLLKAGEKTIIRTHRIDLTPGIRSRTGLGVMVEPGSWGVPSEYSGTDENNFVTRALESGRDNICKILANAFRNV